MIKLNISEIKKHPVGAVPFHLVVTPLELGVEPQDLDLVGEVQISGEMANVGDVLMLSARLNGHVKRVCARCMAEFIAPTEAVVEERFAKSGLTDLDEDALVYDGDLLDVTDVLREGLILVEPISALCREDCKGLCPVCGGDRNVVSCSCDTFIVDPRLASLKGLLSNN